MDRESKYSYERIAMQYMKDINQLQRHDNRREHYFMTVPLPRSFMINKTNILREVLTLTIRFNTQCGFLLVRFLS